LNITDQKLANEMNVLTCYTCATRKQRQ